MCNFVFLSFRGCLILGMRRGRPGAIPPPIPPPPWAKCRPAQGLGLHFRPGGRGNGRGNLIWVRIRTGPWIFFPLLWGIFGLHMVFCRNATPGLRFPYCHNTKHGCPHIPSVSKVPPIVHTSVPKTASHSTPTLPPLYQNAIHSTHPQYQKLLPTVHPHYHPLYQKCNPLYTPLYQKMIPTGPPQFTPLYQK